jgi:DNA-directed RNA polymerase sigma subunit (sigma70/sigma32)
LRAPGARSGASTPGRTATHFRRGSTHYNLSLERIRQLQEQAIGKIRKQMREF